MAERMPLNQDKKEKWRQVLVQAFISSEESAEDEDDCIVCEDTTLESTSRL